MDHLPVPQDRLLDSISIPFLASDAYTSPFQDYPHRNGWELSFSADMTQPRVKYTPDSTADRDLGALLQSWLYFGMLSEFLGDQVDVNLFKKSHGSGTLLVSVYLEKLVCDRTASLLDRAKLGGSDFLVAFRDAFQLNMLIVRKYVLSVMATRTDPSDALSRTCLSVTVMVEYLFEALLRLCQRCGLEILVHQKWRIEDTSPNSVDPSRLITMLMSQKGWCAYDIALLNGAQVKTASTLYFIANLSPPKASFSHSSCTAERCVPMQVEKREYLQAHTNTGCACALIGPDQAILAATIRSGNIPLIVFREGSIEIKHCMQDTKFVTISHVWADGMGNPSGNSMPTCMVNQLQRLVDGVRKSTGTPFWIDTLCIPRGPPDLRTEALLRMREPYERATHVLVIDSYLRQSKATDTSPFELLARITVCSWSQRLWTFQEGRMPQEPARVVFAFADRLVDLLVDLNIPYSHFPTLAAHTVTLELMFMHNQTGLKGAAGMTFPEDHLRFGMSPLREALRTRKTSYAADEALCIAGGIFQLPTSELREIIHADAEVRMVKIWQRIREIPTGIVMSKAAHKLSIKGYRWAPASFMGDLKMSLKDWQGFSGGHAKIVASGLAVRLPGWTPVVGNASCQAVLRRLCDVRAEPSGRSILLFDPKDGRWFECRMGDRWNDSSESFAAGEHLLFINDGSPDHFYLDGQQIGRKSDYKAQGTMEGLLASYGEDQEDDHVLVTVHRHVFYTLVSVNAHELYRSLKDFAERLCHGHSEMLEHLRGDEKKLYEMVSTMTKQFLKDEPDILARMKAENDFHGWGDGTDLAVDDCIVRVKILVELGPCCVVSKAMQANWCVT